MNYVDWTNKLYSIAENSIRSCLAAAQEGRWKEDFITADILKGIKKAPHNVFKIDDEYKSISWDAYKYSGKLEQTYGDIAFIVKIDFGAGKVLEGIAYIEAKRIYHSNDLKSCSFEKIKWDRLNEYASSSDAHYMMFYDADPRLKVKYLCKTIPTRHLLKIKSRKRDIYPFCEYFHQLIGFRLSMGYGLDFDEKKVKEAKGFLENSKRFKYVLTASIKHSPEPNVKPEPILINKELYVEIDRPTLKRKLDNSPGQSFSPG
jgi:hypothetical protein